MAMLECYNCQAPVTTVDQARSKAVIDALITRVGDDFLEAMTDYSTVETVHCRPSANQADAEGAVVYCAGCSMTLVFDGLRLSAPGA